MGAFTDNGGPAHLDSVVELTEDEIQLELSSMCESFMAKMKANSAAMKRIEDFEKQMKRLKGDKLKNELIKVMEEIAGILKKSGIDPKSQKELMGGYGTTIGKTFQKITGQSLASAGVSF